MIDTTNNILEMPTVSIIVPVYNTEKYLNKCLNSLVNQTFKAIEIVCFNDASTDNSLEILNSYSLKDPRVKVINSSTNVKQGGGRNRAIKASNGRYVAFVDSDDWVDTHYIEFLYTSLSSAGADISICDLFESINGVNNEISHLGKNIKQETYFIKQKILRVGCHLCCCLFKRELFFNNNLFFPENVIYEDNAIGAALYLSAEKIVKIDNALYFYRCDNASTTRSKNNLKYFDRLETAVMLLNHVRRLGLYEGFKDEVDERFVRLYYIYSIGGAVFSFDKPQLDRIKYIESTVRNYVSAEAIQKVLQKCSWQQKVVVFFAVHAPFMLKILSIAKEWKKIKHDETSS